jgi:hypothetical protein
MSDYTVRDGSVILTQQELDALNAVVSAGDRGRLGAMMLAHWTGHSTCRAALNIPSVEHHL